MTAASQSTPLSERQAIKLWGQLRTHFVNAQRVMEEIIELRAWEPMGYASFSEAWTAQMSDITIATEIRPHVVYQMITEGRTDADIATAIKGIGRDSAAALRRQKGSGVSAKYASARREKPTVVKQHLRKLPAPSSALHLELGVVKLRRYQRIAKKHGMSVEDISLQAIETRFKELS